jgi:hypothetical protein
MQPESSGRQTPRALVFYGGFRRRGGGAFTHAAASEKELTAMGWQVRIVCLDSLPIFVRYLPHLVEKAVNLLAMPLGFYYKDRVTRFLYRHFIRERADFYLFEDIHLTWNVIEPAITLLHAVWSDNLQAFPVTEAQSLRLIRKEAAAIAGIAHPIATVSQRYRDYLEKTHFARAPRQAPGGHRTGAGYEPIPGRGAPPAGSVPRLLRRTGTAQERGLHAGSLRAHCCH